MMTSKSVKVLLTSGRTLNQGRAMEKGKITSEYEEAVSACELDSTTMESLGVNDGDAIVVKTRLGKAVVRAKRSKDLHQGMAFIPCGPYFNLLIDSNTQYTGMPGFKSLEATITSAQGVKIKSIMELTEQMMEGAK
jgi:formylmethanofuran dehydrogenase subunit D